MPDSKVLTIFTGAEPGCLMVSVPSAQAVSGSGLVGDRYFSGKGTFSKPGQPDREVTLIESEAIEAVNRDQKLSLTAAECRRNVVTQGVALNHLVGKVFKVGGATLRGLDLCEPCSHLQNLTRPGILKALMHRGGLRAQVLEDGVFNVGDPGVVVETAVASS